MPFNTPRKYTLETQGVINAGDNNLYEQENRCQ